MSTIAHSPSFSAIVDTPTITLDPSSFFYSLSTAECCHLPSKIPAAAELPPESFDGGGGEKTYTAFFVSSPFPLPAQHVKFIVGRKMQQRKELLNRDTVPLISFLVWCIVRCLTVATWGEEVVLKEASSRDRVRFFMTLAQRERACQSLLVSANWALPCLL